MMCWISGEDKTRQDEVTERANKCNKINRYLIINNSYKVAERLKEHYFPSYYKYTNSPRDLLALLFAIQFTSPFAIFGFVKYTTI